MWEKWGGGRPATSQSVRVEACLFFLVLILNLAEVQLWPQASGRGVAAISGQAQGGGEPGGEHSQMQRAKGDAGQRVGGQGGYNWNIRVQPG